jgi:WD40 repeat protein
MDDETPGAYRLGAAPDVGTNLGHLGILDAIRIDADYLACVAYGADHKTHLAACGRDIFILDFAAGDDAELSRQHSGAVTCLSISSDCRFALSGDADGGLMLWDVAKLEALRWLNGHQSEVKTAAFSADGAYAASGGNGGAVRLWKLPKGEMILLQHGQLEDVINCVCFSPDGRLLLAVGSKGRARLWDLAARRPEVKLDLGPSYLRSAAFGRDWIVAGSERRFKVCKWHTGTGERVPCFSGFTKNFHGFQNAFVTPEARVILTVRFNPWEPEVSDYGPDHIDHLYFKGYSEAAAMQKNGANLKSLPDQFNDFFLESWDVFNEVRMTTIGLGPEMPVTLATSPDGHRVLAGFERGMVALVAI